MNFIKDFYHKREIGRLEFFWRTVLSVVLFIPFYFFSFAISWALSIEANMNFPPEKPSILLVMLPIVFLLISLFFVFIQILVTIKRSRSIGISSWWVLLLFIPLFYFLGGGLLIIYIIPFLSVNYVFNFIFLWLSGICNLIYFLFLLFTPPGYFKPKELSTNPKPAPMTPPVSAETPTQTEDQGERG